MMCANQSCKQHKRYKHETGKRWGTGKMNMSSPILPIAQYAARSQDDAVLRVSSSGGVFTELARVVFAKKGVVVAAGWNRATMTVEHRCVESEAELADLRGSKYVTSDMSGVYKPMERFISEGRQILFVGTPCQVAAIRHRFGNPENLILCAIACHSNVPQDVWALYCDDIQRKFRSRIVDVQFRDKRYGWRKSTFNVVFDNQTHLAESLYANFYAKVFFSGWASKTACLNCKFRAGHSGADLLIGDFWGVEDVLSNLDDGKGISVVLAYSLEGKDFLSEANLKLYAVTYRQAVAKNPFIEVSPKTDFVKRARFQRVYKSRGLHCAVRYAEFGPQSKEIFIRVFRFVRYTAGRAWKILRMIAKDQKSET